MPAQIFRFSADNFAKPLLNFWRINFIIVNPAFISSVVRRINVDAFYFPYVERHKSFQSFQIVSMNYKILRAIADRKRFNFLQKLERNFLVMVRNLLFSYPRENGHI